MAYIAKGFCVDCGQEFTKRAESQVRCPECQRIHRRELDRIRKHAYKPQPEQCTAVMRNGEPQICKMLGKCFYSGGWANGCSYLLETGHSRASQGLYIKDGKCDAFIEKGTKRRRRLKPVHFGKEK